MAGFEDLLQGAERFGPLLGGLWSEYNNSRASDQLGQTANTVLNRSDPFGGQRATYAQLLNNMLTQPGGINTIPGYAGARDETVRRSSRNAAARGTVGTGSMASDLAEQLSLMDLQALQAQQQFLAGAAGAGMAPDTRSYASLQQQQADAQRNQGGSIFDGIRQTIDAGRSGVNAFDRISNFLNPIGSGLDFVSGFAPAFDLAGAGAGISGFGGAIGGGLSTAPFAGLDLGGAVFGGAPSGGFGGIGNLFSSFSDDLVGGLGNLFSSGAGLSSSAPMGLGGLAGAAVPLGLLSGVYSLGQMGLEERDVFGRPQAPNTPVQAYNRDGTPGAWDAVSADWHGGLLDRADIRQTGSDPFNSGVYLDHGFGYNNYADADVAQTPTYRDEGDLGGGLWWPGTIQGEGISGFFTPFNRNIEGESVTPQMFRPQDTGVDS